MGLPPLCPGNCFVVFALDLLSPSVLSLTSAALGCAGSEKISTSIRSCSIRTSNYLLVRKLPSKSAQYVHASFFWAVIEIAPYSWSQMTLFNSLSPRMHRVRCSQCISLQRLTSTFFQQYFMSGGHSFKMSEVICIEINCSSEIQSYSSYPAVVCHECFRKVSTWKKTPATPFMIETKVHADMHGHLLVFITTVVQPHSISVSFSTLASFAAPLPPCSSTYISTLPPFCYTNYRVFQRKIHWKEVWLTTCHTNPYHSLSVPLHPEFLGSLHACSAGSVRLCSCTLSACGANPTCDLTTRLPDILTCHWGTASCVEWLCEPFHSTHMFNPTKQLGINGPSGAGMTLFLMRRSLVCNMSRLSFSKVCVPLPSHLPFPRTEI